MFFILCVRSLAQNSSQYRSVDVIGHIVPVETGSYGVVHATFALITHQQETVLDWRRRGCRETGTTRSDAPFHGETLDNTPFLAKLKRVLGLLTETKVVRQLALVNQADNNCFTVSMFYHLVIRAGFHQAEWHIQPTDEPYASLMR